MNGDSRLGDWIVRPQRDCIERGDESVHLKPKAMAVLECLIAAEGAVVTRSELFERVWHGAEVSDATLTQCIVELRQALGDSARDPEFIETVPKVGFRLIPTASPVTEERPSPREAPTPAAPKPKTRRLIRAILVSGALLAIAVLSGYFWLNPDEAMPESGDGPATLAVLPFADLSPDQDQGWFADGLSEELINRLARLEGLRVTGRTSSFYYKYKNVTVGEVAENLGVDHLLDGSIRREGDQLRISAQLLDASSGFPLWSDIYDRPIEDIFAVQQEIAESVATALSIRLDVGNRWAFARSTNSVEAFERFLLAMSLFQEFTADSMVEAIRLLEQAVEIDPDYADAWLWLAQLYKMAPQAIDERLEIDWSARAGAALEQARRLEPDAPVMRNMQINQLTHERRWAEVEGILAGIDPARTSSDPQLAFFYGIFLCHVGRAAEAQLMLERARLLEPLAGHVGRVLAWAYLINGRTDEALASYENAWRKGNTIRRLGSQEGLRAALATGNREQIETWLARTIEHADTAELDFYEAMAERLDDPTAATAWLRDTFRAEASRFMDPITAAWAAYFGDQALVLEVNQRSADNWLFWYPLFADLRSAPEFRELAQRMGLAEYWREFTWADFCEPAGEDDFACR